MSYRLHDAKVAWWAWQVRHPHRHHFKVEIVWPLSDRRYIDTSKID